MRRMMAVTTALLGVVAARAEPVVALSAADREAALDAGEARNSGALPLNGNPRGIHGEVGMAVGSRGYRSMYGTTVVPLGQAGSAAFAFETTQGNGFRRR